MLAGLPLLGFGQSTWNGSVSTNWNTAGNWSSGVPSGANATIDLATGNICTLANNASATPVDIRIGDAAGLTGRVDHLAGTLSTGNGNWFFAGINTGTGYYNLANTASAGTGLTGFAQGSGSLTAANIWVGGAWYNDNGIGTMKINTTGTINAGNSTWVSICAGESWNGGTGIGEIDLESGTVNAAGGLWLGVDNLAGSGTASGTLKMTGGTLNVATGGYTGPSYVGYNNGSGTMIVSNGLANFGDELQVGGSDTGGTGFNAAGTLAIYGGNLNLGALTVARGNNNQNDCNGTVVVNGGALVSTNDVILGFAGMGLGKVAINGGAFIIGPAGTKWFMVGFYDTTTGELDITNGTLSLDNGSSIKMCRGGNAGANVVNQAGGTVTFYSDAGVTVGGGGNLDLNFAGGSSSSSTYNLMGGALTVPQIVASSTSGAGTFNFNGGTLKPTASSTTFMQGLSAANVMAGGAVIDTAGYNITIAQTLLNGDGLGGGLTKTDNGTLTLAGGYAYTGATKVLGGTLSLSTALGVPGSAGDLVVSNATLTLDASSGTAMQANNVIAGPGATLNIIAYASGNSINGAGNLTFGNNTTVSLTYGLVTGNPSTAVINAAGSLTQGTNIVINVSATGLGVGIIPLCTAGTGTATTNGFALGSLPAGVKGVLTNSTSTELDLLVTSAGQLLSWRGADALGNPLPNWDINTSSNWWDINDNNAKYLQYAGNTIGDNVIFGNNGYNTDGTNHVNLSVTVLPATVTFSSSSPYTLTGTGGIGGSTSLVVTNMNNSVFLGTANSYTGGTVVGGGTLMITNDNALGNASAGVTMAGGTLQWNAGLTSSRSMTATAYSGLDVVAGATVQLNASISGAGGLDKTDNGTLVLAGNNTYAGSTVVSAGTLNLSGTVTNAAVTVGDVSGNAVLNLSGGLNADNLFVGNGSGAVAAVYQTGGSVIANGGGGDCLDVGNISGGFGYYNILGGSVTANGMAVGGENNTGSGFSGTGGDGIMEINGGAVNDTGWLVMNRGATAENGILNIFSGSLSFAGGGLVCDWGSGQTAVISMLGGTLSSANQGIGLGGSGNTGILNLNGGVVSVQSVGGNFGGTYGQLNFNGGTLQAVGNMANPLRLTSANVYGNGATIDDGGYTVSLDQPLLAPPGYGVSGIVLSDGGSGYVAPPFVTFSGGSGSGSNATAIAQINVATGTITNILVTCPGAGYVSSDTLTANFSGGGSSAVPPASVTVNLAANTSGGLIKKGSGILTLAGANTYTGVTVVSNGTLRVAGPPVLHLSFDNVSGTNVINDGTGGSAMNGALYGSATIVSGGKFGNCLSISGADASSSSCRIASSVVPLTVGSSSSWSVAMWVQSSTAGGCYAYQGDGGWGWGNTTFHLNNGTADGPGSQAGGVRWGQGWETGTASVNDGAWHHVVLTFNGNTKAAYVDGVLDPLTTDQWGNVGTGGQFWIGGGANTGDGTANLNGLVDEVYVFDRAISEAEVQSLFNNNSLPGTTGVPGAVTVASGATLGGNGIVGGPVTVQSGGTISAGASIGTLTINNNLTLGGNVLAEVNTSVSPSNDLVVVTGILTNSGTGTVTLSNLGPALMAGNSFTLFSKPLANGGAMALTTTPALASGLVLSNRMALDGSVLVVQSIPSTPTNLTYSVSNNSLTLGWPLNYTGWLVQSNSVGIGSTNWFVVPGSSATNSMSFTIDPAQTNVFFRLVYP